MKSDLSGPTTRNQNFEQTSKVQLPLMLMTSEDEQNSKSPSSRINVTDQLLDIIGLLEIEELVRNIKKEKRLKCESDKNIRHKV